MRQNLRGLRIELRLNENHTDSFTFRFPDDSPQISGARLFAFQFDGLLADAMVIQKVAKGRMIDDRFLATQPLIRTFRAASAFARKMSATPPPSRKY